MKDVRFVLVHPLRAGNVGSAVRAVANIGVGRVIVVDDGSLGQGPGIRADPRAREMAAGALEALDSLEVVGQVTEALRGCPVAVAFTARARARREPRLVDLRDAIPDLRQAAATSPVALLFGPEDRGLSNAEMVGCTAMVRIPAAPEYPVLNVASAVLVAAWELTRDRAHGPAPAPHPLADLQDLERLVDLFERVFSRARFLGRRTGQGRVTLGGLLGRCELQRREYRFLMAALRQLDRALPEPGASAMPDRPGPADPTDSPGGPDGPGDRVRGS